MSKLEGPPQGPPTVAAEQPPLPPAPPPPTGLSAVTDHAHAAAAAAAAVVAGASSMGAAPPPPPPHAAAQPPNAAALAAAAVAAVGGAHVSAPPGVYLTAEEEGESSKSAPAFLEKLYDILEDPQYQELICWHDNGRSLLIKQVDEFSSQVLPKYFKHSNFQSFIRQLNMYAFSKTKHDPNWREFRQPNFQQNKRGLLRLIKRKSADSNALAKQTRSKMEDMVADLDKLKQDVNNAKGRLGLVEAHLWMTTDKCNAIQAENQSLWKILADNAPQVKGMRAEGGDAAGVAMVAAAPGAAPTVEGDAGANVSPATAAAYAARFQQIHNALRSLPTGQLPVSLAPGTDAATLAAAVQSAGAPTLAPHGVVDEGVVDHDKRDVAAVAVVAPPGVPTEEPAMKKKRTE